MKGEERLFNFFEQAQTYANKDEIKKEIAKALILRRSTISDYARECNPFGKAFLQVLCEALLDVNRVANTIFFSGCKGFRVLFKNPALWIRVSNKIGYGNAIVDHLDESRDCDGSDGFRRIFARNSIGFGQ